jgi:hypothetical protein
MWEARDPDLAAGVLEAYGSTERKAILGAVQESSAPGALLARAAPLLLTAADRREGWAQTALDAEMTELATLAVDHARQWWPDRREVTMGLVGGTRSPRGGWTQC